MNSLDNLKDNNYLFLSVANFSGSTLIHNLLALSENVITLPQNTNRYCKSGLVEGSSWIKHSRKLINMKEVLGAVEEYACNDLHYTELSETKEIFNREWNKVSCDPHKIRMQKNTMDLYRMKSITNEFKNVFWVIMVREPYSYAYSILKRVSYPLSVICKHIGRTMEIQRDNAINFSHISYSTTYEKLIENPQSILNSIGLRYPMLGSITVPEKITVKGVTKKIENHNIKENRELDKELTEHLFQYSEAISYWGYSLKKTP